MDSYSQSDAQNSCLDRRGTKKDKRGPRRDEEVRLRVGQAKSLKRKRGSESEVASTK